MRSQKRISASVECFIVWGGWGLTVAELDSEVCRTRGCEMVFSLQGRAQCVQRSLQKLCVLSGVAEACCHCPPTSESSCAACQVTTCKIVSQDCLAEFFVMIIHLSSSHMCNRKYIVVLLSGSLFFVLYILDCVQGRIKLFGAPRQ